MFRITEAGANRLDLEVSGKVDAASMRAALDDLLAKSRDIEDGRMLYTITDFHLPTLGAIGIEVARLPALFGLMRKFRRAAVLTDRKWLQKASEFEGAMFPGLEIKAFDLDQRAAAQAWLAA